MIIGAGLAGLAAAKQLMLFVIEVTVLEGRKRGGGRVYKKEMEGGNKVDTPLGLLGRQLSYTLHKVRDQCLLYCAEADYIELLEKASKVSTELSQVFSLGEKLETLQKDFGVAIDVEEMRLFNWHLANLGYANAISLAFLDQDDPYDMGGDHNFLSGGNGRLVHPLTENVLIIFLKIVHIILFDGDMTLCMVPLRVLKSRSISFILELPKKIGHNKKIGFGHGIDDSLYRGEFFLF
uniref:Uncharacterized protein n=1 Tax=Solanum lycopersicum TaxID=4081 RepID=A0A3Q7HF30_SOLLC